MSLFFKEDNLENLERCKLLIENGADVNAKNKYGQTAYDIAVRNRRYKIKNFLDDYDKIFDYKNAFNYYKVVNILIEEVKEENIVKEIFSFFEKDKKDIKYNKMKLKELKQILKEKFQEKE